MQVSQQPQPALHGHEKQKQPFALTLSRSAADICWAPAGLLAACLGGAAPAMAPLLRSATGALTAAVTGGAAAGVAGSISLSFWVTLLGGGRS